MIMQLLKRYRNAISVLILVGLWLPFPAVGQGNLEFVNFAPQFAPVTIETAAGRFNPDNGAPGAHVGSDYTASLFFVNGAVTNRADFESANPVLFASADTRFFGITGTEPEHGPTADGAGLFDGGIVYLSAASGVQVSIQVRAWYNGGGLYANYSQALAANQNVGESNLIPITLATGLAPPPTLDGLLPFTVGIPEPSTLTMLGLGGLAMLVFLRRNRV